MPAPTVIVVTGRTHGYTEWANGHPAHEVPSFADKLNDVLADLYPQGVSVTIDCKPIDASTHVAYILVKPPDQPRPTPAPQDVVPAHDLLKLPEAAALLGVSRETVGRHAREGTIRSVRVGRAVSIPRDEVDRLRRQSATV